MNIFVAKLNQGTTSESLQFLFEQFGEVTSSKVIIDRETGESNRITSYNVCYTKLLRLRHFKWHIFSKKAVQPANIGNATVFPINADRFVQSLSHADSVLCGAGFSYNFV